MNLVARVELTNRNPYFFFVCYSYCMWSSLSRINITNQTTLGSTFNNLSTATYLLLLWADNHHYKFSPQGPSEFLLQMGDDLQNRNGYEKDNIN